jgi:hypothetical protein
MLLTSPATSVLQFPVKAAYATIWAELFVDFEVEPMQLEHSEAEESASPVQMHVSFAQLYSSASS